MSARRTKATAIAEAAAVLRPIRPDLAAELDAFPKPGRKVVKDADGFTPTIRAKAALWIEMQRRLRTKDEADVLDDTARDHKVSWDYVDRLMRLEGEPHVRRLLKAQGHLESQRWDS